MIRRDSLRRTSASLADALLLQRSGMVGDPAVVGVWEGGTQSGSGDREGVVAEVADVLNLAAGSASQVPSSFISGASRTKDSGVDCTPAGEFTQHEGAQTFVFDLFEIVESLTKYVTRGGRWMEASANHSLSQISGVFGWGKHLQ